MKSRHLIESVKWLSRYDDPKRRVGSFPHLTFEYQAPRRGGTLFGDGEPVRPPGFTRLANEVLRSDASRSFRLETAVLSIVTLISAWPIVVMIREVIRLLK